MKHHKLKYLILFMLWCALPLASYAQTLFTQEELKLTSDESQRMEVRRHLQASRGDSVVLKTMHITLSEAGTLEAALGDDIEMVDSLYVSGPVNADDIKTMWKSTFYGYVSYLNLQDADIEGKKIPEWAFFDSSEQLNGSLYLIGLKEIVLPDNLEEIDDCAFYEAKLLEEISMPSSLKRIGQYAFWYCEKLKTDPLILPNGIKTIEAMSFNHCISLNEVILPEFVERIEGGAFQGSGYTGVSSIHFPETLQSIGLAAFSSTKLKTLAIPGNCEFPDYWHFARCYQLTEVFIADGVKIIPNNFLYECSAITQLRIPGSVTTIGKEAFSGLRSLESLYLEEGLYEIGEKAFSSCHLKQIVLPSTLCSMGNNSFTGNSKLERIYCKAEIPPVQSMAFGDSRKDVPLYVPAGTADAYRNATGWSMFTNIIETDSFPTSGAIDITVDVPQADGAKYDITGRRIENPAKGQIYIQNGKKYIGL